MFIRGEKGVNVSLLGLDVGTTGCKAVAFNLDGEIVAAAYREYPLHSPQPGWGELDPEQVWRSVADCIRGVAAESANDPIRSLAVSSQGEACHPVAADGSCLHRSIVTFDARTAGYVDWWQERISREEIGEITGMPLHGMYSLNKILWIKENLPEVFRKTHKFLCYEDFVVQRLGLEPSISHSLAARTMAFDVTSKSWSEKMLSIAGIDSNLLSQPKPSGEALGTIPDAVARELGLNRGVVVATGGHDQPAGALGAGILTGGDALYATGTVDCICPIFQKPEEISDAIAHNLCCYPACVPGLSCSIAFNFTGGSLLKWYRDTFCEAEKHEADHSGRDVYDIVCSKIPENPENVLILPHFTVTGTPEFDTASRGLIAGLTLDTSREQIVSAILSGVTFEMKLNLELLRNSGVEITRLRASGGGAKSPVWVQRKADILGLPISVLEVSEAPALGVAMLGGKAAGLIDDIGAFAAEVVRISDTIDPEPRRHAAYRERFEIYREVYPAMKSINHRLARLSDVG